MQFHYTVDIASAVSSEEFLCHECSYWLHTNKKGIKYRRWNVTRNSSDDSERELFIQ